MHKLKYMLEDSKKIDKNLAQDFKRHVISNFNSLEKLKKGTQNINSKKYNIQIPNKKSNISLLKSLR